MKDRDLAAEFGAFSTGNLCNAHPGVRALGASIRPLFGGIRIAGPARTARISPGQNAAIHLAIHQASPGDVLVVDGGGSLGYGPFGDILATACQKKGIVGLVISSTVRDSDEIEALRFPVFCLGTNPSVTAKTEPGQVDVEIRCGEATVHPGDLIVGDRNGVVVVPRGIVTDVAEKAAAVVRKEEEIVKRLEAGETTYEIFGLGR